MGCTYLSVFEDKVSHFPVVEEATPLPEPPDVLTSHGDLLRHARARYHARDAGPEGLFLHWLWHVASGFLGPLNGTRSLVVTTGQPLTTNVEAHETPSSRGPAH